MDRDAVIRHLRAQAPRLQKRGILHMALFGSVARGEEPEDGDIDLMIEIDPAARLTVYDYVGLISDLKALLPGPVDIANCATLKAHVRPSAERDAVPIF